MAKHPNDPKQTPPTDDRTTVHGPQTNIGGDVHGNVYSGTIGHIGDVYITAAAEARALFTGVPPRPPHFLGRQDLVDELVTQLCAGHTTALSAEGLPGVGKTTLAVMLAHHRRILEHFRDGVLWAGLGRNAEVAGILAAWGTVLGVDVSMLPHPQQRARAVADAIGQRRLLLVIDDAWEVEPALLLKCGGPNCVHLLTTRDQAIARQFAGAEQVVSVPVLDDDPAFALLRALAPEACQANPEAARALAQQVGNLPLALELVGGYLAAPERSYFPELSAEALAEMTDPHRRLALAQQRLGDGQGAKVTLQETIALSLEDLPESVQDAFYALGAFAPKPERFDLSAALAVTGADARALALLVARNLVEKEGETLALHQTVADVARTEMPGEAVVRHRGYYLGVVEEDKEDWWRIEEVYGQVVHAWGQLSAGEQGRVDFVDALSTYQTRRGLWQDRLDWLAAALAEAREQDDPQAEARMLNEYGFVYNALGDKQQALDYYEQALCHQVGDKGGEAITLNNIGGVYDALGDKRQALAYYEQALPLFRQIEDKGGEATTLNNIGAAYRSLGEMPQALAYYEQALHFFRQIGDKRGEAVTLNNIGRVYDALGDRPQALAYYEQALPLRRQVGDKNGEAATLNNIGLVYNVLGDMPRALAYYEQALPLCREVGDKNGEATTLNNIGLAYRSLGEMQQALTYYAQALPLRLQIEDRWGERVTRYNMTMAHRDLGNLAAAEEQLRIVVAIDEAVGHPNLENDRAILTQVQALRRQQHGGG